MTPEEAYRILEVAPGAGADAVQEAYRNAAKRTHPDHAPGYGLHDRKEWLRVRDAYECLRATGFPNLAPAPAEPRVGAAEPRVGAAEPRAPKRYRAPEWLERQWANAPKETLGDHLSFDEHERRALLRTVWWILVIIGFGTLLVHMRRLPSEIGTKSGVTIRW